MNRMLKMGLGLSFAAVLAAGCSTPNSASDNSITSSNSPSIHNAAGTQADLNSEIANRAAHGDITTHGGARRLTGDQAEFMKLSLIHI